MSSIIVLDSSDEDEAPHTKRVMLSSPIPTTLTAIKSKCPTTSTAANNVRHRHIPSSITVTARLSPVTSSANNRSSPRNLSGMQTMPTLQPAPHLQQQHQQQQQQRQQQQQLKTTTPSVLPPLIIGQQSKNTPMLMSLIPSDTSISASATPPMKLLATPPHTAAILNEPVITSPRLNFIPIKQSSPSIHRTMQNDVELRDVQPNNQPQSAHSPIESTRDDTGKPLTATPTPRRVVPIAILKKTDAEWLEKRCKPITCLADDGLMETLPSANNSPAVEIPIPKKLNSLKAKTQAIDLENSKQTSPNHITDRLLSVSSANIIPAPEHSTADVNPNAIVCSQVLEQPQKQNCPTDDPVNRHDQLAESTQKKVNGNLPQSATNASSADPAQTETMQTSESNKTLPLSVDYEELLRVCREADPSSDMEKLINKKLLRYYHEVHPDFVKSRGFRRTIRNVIDRIREDSELVYYHLKTIVDELNIRRKSKQVVTESDECNDEEVPENVTTKRTNHQIHKLNKALKILTVRIKALEETEVDWEDMDSSYLQVERYKKRACKIYEKICQLTGENKNARRIVKQSIQYKGTEYEEFNKTLQSYVNHTKEFPDFYDVLRLLEYCDRKYNYNLLKFEMKNIAFAAFKEVGKLLQQRRKTDLYEMVTYFTTNSKDPAEVDPSLAAKLNENQKNQRKISDIIEKFAREQELLKEVRQNQMQKTSMSGSSDSSTSEDGGENEIATTHAENNNQTNSVSSSRIAEVAISDTKTDNSIENGSLSDIERRSETENQTENHRCNMISTVTSTILESRDDAATSEVADPGQREQLNVSSGPPVKTVNNNILRTKTAMDALSNVNVVECNREITSKPNGKLSMQDTSARISSLPLHDFEAPTVMGFKIENVTSLANADDCDFLNNSFNKAEMAEIIISDEES